jgi:prophage antirepressor-like protein
MNITIWEYKDNPVRTKMIDGQIWFSALDVCNVLGHSNPHQKISDRCTKRGVRKTEVPHPQNKNKKIKINFINESNLYRLIFSSRVKGAKAFQDWIFEEVIPEIRKTGQYQIKKDLKLESKENRNLITQAWKEQGCEKSYHFINLTLQEYKSLGFEKGLRKKDLDEKQLRELMALEAIELVKLSYKEDAGYYGCKDTIIESGNTVKEIAEKAKKKKLRRDR